MTFSDLNTSPVLRPGRPKPWAMRLISLTGSSESVIDLARCKQRQIATSGIRTGDMFDRPNRFPFHSSYPRLECIAKPLNI